MIIAGATIGAVSFGIQAYNAWRNEKNAKTIQEKQEAYQRAVMEKNFEVTMEQFHAQAEPANNCRTGILGKMAFSSHAFGNERRQPFRLRN